MKNKRVLRATAVLLGMVTLLTGVVFGLKSSVNMLDIMVKVTLFTILVNPAL